MLIALGRGDKYRLAHIRESLEIGKELYISDQEFLQDLVKTHLKDRIYQARIVSISDKPDLFCENCSSTISADEKFCTNCGTQKPEPIPLSTVDMPELTPEPETKQDAGSGKKQAFEGFAFTADGDIGESATVETARDNLTKKISELETTVSWKAYDVKAKKKVEIQNPKAVKMKNGKWAIKGTSSITGIKVFRIVGNKKPNIYSEKTVESTKVEKESTTSTEKPKGSTKADKEVVSRYYRSPEVESKKVKKSKSNKCAKCGSKITAKDLFCTNCGAKR
ncbi:MAG: zinc ribbon domain-containing protein [Proteobacteria bacterium]|nr:zinc ribbon domain-containing protein [Pseudomonadota bacterium]